MAQKKLFSAKAGKQISIFIDNRPGSLASVIDLLGEYGLNMTALSLSEGLELGYLRIIVEQHAEAVKVLRAKKHLVIERDVLLLEVANEPGGMASAIDRLARGGVNVEYAYSGNSFSNSHSLIVVRVLDVANARKVLAAATAG
jgi:hypothetical protein